MKTTPVVVIVLLVVSVAASVAQTTRCSQSSTPGCNSNLRAADFGTLPLTFEANRGQVDPRVSYVSRGRGYTIFLTDEASLIKLQRRIKTRVTHTVITTRFVGQRPDAPLSALEPLDSRVNYLVGDRALWRTDIPEYGRVQRTGIYPGIDLVYYGKEGQLEYDLVVAPNADPDHVRMRIEGADSFELNESGDLVLRTPAGDLVQRKPVAYQMIGGKRRVVDARFLLRDGEISFALGAYRRDRQLIIDPVLVYATYFGKFTQNESGISGAAVDSTGHLIMAGSTGDTSFPVKSGSYDITYNGNFDAFVVKLTKAGDGRIFSTYLGGSGSESGHAVAVGSSDAIYVAGLTTSTDFSHFIGANRQPGVAQAFVAELNAGGTTLVYATSFGGNGPEGTAANAISVDRDGNAHVAGNTTSDFLPVTSNAFQKSYQSAPVIGGDGFAAILNPSGSGFLMCTYLGGPGADYASAVANDTSGNIYVGGVTFGSFPTTPGTVQSSSAADFAGYVAKLNSSGGRVWATYLASSDQAWVRALAVDDSNNVYATGFTSRPDFPTTSGAFRRTSSGGSDAFVAKLNSTASVFLYSTLLGGSGDDSAQALKVDSAGNAYVSGFATSTGSSDFPTTTDAFRRTFGGGNSDAFLSVLNATGSGLRYSTYYGGNNSDFGLSLVLDSANNMFIAGNTNSSNLPFKNGAQSTPGPMFMAKFSAISSSGGSCSAPTSSPGTNICWPPDADTVSSPVVVNATLRWDNQTITGSKVYVDGTSVFSGTEGQTSISQSVDLPPGSHHVTVRMWNSAGQSFSVTRTFTVEGTPLTCSTPSMSPGIHVCAPPSGGVVSSPAALSATLRWDGKTITGSRVYVDSNAVFTGVKGQTSISTSVPLKSGGHHLTLRMWNSAGQSFSVSRSFTVQ